MIGFITLCSYGSFALASVLLVIIDIKQKRLPDAVVLPSLVVVGSGLTLAAILRGVDGEAWVPLVTTVGGAVALFAFYLLLALLQPGALGGGDVKLAALIGLVLGHAGLNVLLVGALAGFVLVSIAALILRASQLRTPPQPGPSLLPFGPFMIVGAWAALIAAWVGWGAGGG